MTESRSNSKNACPAGREVLLFDGTCNLCSASVQFILQRERDSELQFASLQSEVGRQLLVEHGFAPDRMDSMILIDPMQNSAFDRSNAALRVVRHLKAPWRWAGIFVCIPKPIRDWCYRILAKNRYRIFGQSEECWVPSPELQTRFLG